MTWQPIETAPRDGTIIEITALEDDGEAFEVWPMRWCHLQRNEVFAPGMVGMWRYPSEDGPTWREGDGGPTHRRPVDHPAQKDDTNESP